MTALNMQTTPFGYATRAVPRPVHSAQGVAESVSKPINYIRDLPSVWSLPSEVNWLIDGFLPRGSVNLVTGASGCGKTWLAYAIAGAVASGNHFAG